VAAVSSVGAGARAGKGEEATGWLLLFAWLMGWGGGLLPDVGDVAVLLLLLLLLVGSDGGGGGEGLGWGWLDDVGKLVGREREGEVGAVEASALLESVVVQEGLG